MAIGTDLEEYLDTELEQLVESHLEAWKERFFRKKVEDVVFDYQVNYDKDSDFEYIEEEVIERKLTDEEKTHISERFVEKLKEIYYL